MPILQCTCLFLPYIKCSWKFWLTALKCVPVNRAVSITSLSQLSLPCCLQAESEVSASLWRGLAWAVAEPESPHLCPPGSLSKEEHTACPAPAGSGYSPTVWNNFWKGPHFPVSNLVLTAYCLSSRLWAAAGWKCESVAQREDHCNAVPKEGGGRGFVWLQTRRRWIVCKDLQIMIDTNTS